MYLEHVAINVPDPAELAAWYTEHLGWEVVRRGHDPTDIHFLADGGGRLIEVYNNPRGEMPDYAAMSPYTLHIALVVEGDIEEVWDRLVAAGARPEGEIEDKANGDRLGFVRDPWGITLQLAKRARRM